MKFSLFESLLQAVSRHPYAAVASVTAPLFMTDDKRGYLRSALVTSPLVFAGASAVPNLFKRTKKETLEFMGAVAKDMSQRVVDASKPTHGELERLIADRSIDINTVEKMVTQYIQSNRRAPVSVSSKRILDYFDSLTLGSSRLKEKIASTTNPTKRLKLQRRLESTERFEKEHTRLFSNAVQGANLDAMSHSEWVMGGDKALAYSVMDRTQMRSVIQSRSNNPDFLRDVQSRLAKATHLVDKGGDIPFASHLAPRSRVVPIDFADPAWRKQGLARFESVKSKAGQILSTATKDSNIEDLRLLVDDVLTGKTGNIISLEIERTFKQQGKVTKGVIHIPVPDEHGLIRYGNRAGYLGVGRKVIDPEGNVHRIDEWIAQMVVKHPEFSNKQLQEEIDSIVHFSAHDPRSNFMRYGQHEAMLGESQALVRSPSAAITSLPVFQGMKFDELHPAMQVNMYKKFLSSGQFSTVGPAAGITKGVLQLRELEDLSYSGVASARKQDATYRAMSKEFRLQPRGPLTGDFTPRLGNTAFGRYGIQGQVGINLPVGGVLPEDKTLLASLGGTWADAQANKSTFMSKLMARGVSEEQAAKAFGNLEKYYESGHGRIFSNIARLGEADYWVDPNVANQFSVQHNVVSQVDRLGLKDMQAAIGMQVDKETFLGSLNFTNVHPEAEGVITSIVPSEDNSLFNIHMTYNHEFNRAKLDVLGVKGQMFHDDDAGSSFNKSKEMLNEYFETIGSTQYFGNDVKAISDAAFVAGKTEPFSTRASIAAEVMKRLRERGQSGLLSEFEGQLKHLQVNPGAIQLEMNNAALGAATSEAARAARLTRMEDLSRVTKTFFDQVSQQITTANGFGDPVLSRYARAGGDIEAWMMLNHLPGIASSWAHSDVYLPKQVAVTPDFFGYLSRNNRPGQISELVNRLQYVGGGDPNQTTEFGKMLLGGKYKPGSGDVVVGLQEALSVHSGPYSSNSRRAGTIFDPSVEKYKKNFWLSYANKEGETAYLPVPGTEAYGATSPSFEPGKVQTREFQAELFKARDALDAGNLELQDKILGNYVKVANDELLSGKKGALRPSAIDPHALPGYIETRYSNVSPFEVAISPDRVRYLPKANREALEAEGFTYASLGRQPHSEVHSVRVVADPSLAGSNWFGMDPAIMGGYAADSDMDPANLYFWRPGSDAYAEAARDITPGSSQWKVMEINRAYQGTADEGRSATRTALKSIESRMGEEIEAARALTESAIKRTAGGATGALSNSVTKLMMHVTRSGTLGRDPELAAHLNNMLFPIRQAAISAPKSHVQFDLEEAIRLAARINESTELNNAEDATNALKSALLDMESKLMKPIAWTPEAGRVFGVAETTEGIRPLRIALNSEVGQKAIRTLMNERNRGVSRSVRNLTGSSTNMLDYNRNLFANLEDSLEPALRRGVMNEVSAAELGAMNIRTRGATAAKSIGAAISEGLHGTGGTLVAGLGLAALAGALMTKNKAAVVPAFSRPSSSSYRPEVQIGASDMIPGEAVPGTMSGSPPRRSREPSAQVQTGIAVPVNQSVDLEVRMRAKDRNRIAEMSRLLSQISSNGNSNITVNMRGDTRLGSLRMREKLRDLRDGS